MRIESLQHPLVKHWTKLRKQRAYRWEQRRVLLAGRSLVEEVMKDHTPVHLIVGPDGSREGIEVSASVLKKVSGLETLTTVAAEFELPAPTEFQEGAKVLFLDRVSDPGNVGALLRTALAFGWDRVVFLDGGIDPFNDKLLRASKGALFRLPYSLMRHEELSELELPLIAADLHGSTPSVQNSPFGLVLGSESQGVDSSIQASRVTLEMSGEMESLNVAVAGGILMYLLGADA